MMERITNIEIFVAFEGAIPLYEENSTIVESKIITVMIISIKMSVFFLVRINATPSSRSPRNYDESKINSQKCTYKRAIRDDSPKILIVTAFQLNLIYDYQY